MKTLFGASVGLGVLCTCASLMSTGGWVAGAVSRAWLLSELRNDHPAFAQAPAR